MESRRASPEQRRERAALDARSASTAEQFGKIGIEHNLLAAKQVDSTLNQLHWNGKAPGRTRTGAEALSVAEEVFRVDGLDVQVLRSEVTTRQAFVLAPTVGKTVTDYEPEGKAAGEIRSLAEEIAKCLQTTVAV